MADIQRALILSAMCEVCAERGAAKTTVAHVVQRARISRRTFYELFDDGESCLLRALDDAIARTCELMSAVHDPRLPWRERIRASLTVLLRFFDEEPAIGRLLIVESLAAGPSARARRARALAELIPALEAGGRKGAQAPRPMAAEGAVGAVLFVIHHRMLDSERASLVELINPLMSVIVLPYLGAEAAEEELTRTVATPAMPARECRPPSNPLRDLDMRITYRTMRVLVAIGAHSESSNRQVGRLAGVEDAGQISKLLSRLRRLGLIANATKGAMGAPNSWTLTSIGSEVHEAILAGTYSVRED